LLLLARRLSGHEANVYNNRFPNHHRILLHRGENEKKRRTEREQGNRLLILRPTNTYTQYSFLFFVVVYSQYVCEKGRSARALLRFFFFVHDLWDNRACLSFSSGGRIKKQREKDAEFPKQHNSY
jgi:hypothetical protein